MFADRNVTPDLNSLEEAARELSKPIARPKKVKKGDDSSSDDGNYKAM
jgi:hypothetical protein